MIRLLNYKEFKQFENVKIYAGDSFNDPANARFKNLKYENIEENPSTIGNIGKHNKIFLTSPSHYM